MTLIIRDLMTENPRLRELDSNKANGHNAIAAVFKETQWTDYNRTALPEACSFIF